MNDTSDSAASRPATVNDPADLAGSRPEDRSSGAVPATPLRTLVHRHLMHGWIGLLVFVLLGTTLEALHAWKSSAYLGVGNETRRLMWTLAHAHGIGLSLVQLGLAATLGLAFESVSPRLRAGSHLVDWATVLIPLGFWLGGLATYEADPGLGVLLVPVGALALIVAVVCVLASLASRR